MSTLHTPPIDLYAETDEREETAADAPVDVKTSPRDNGDVEDEAVQAGERRLEQVLGW